MLGAISLIVAICLTGNLQEAVQGTKLKPAERSLDAMQVRKQGDDGFPVVDWDALKAINPDIVGWLTIPGTPVDYPVLKASGQKPDFYLKHDVWRNFDMHGSIYVDAACPQDIDSLNVIVYGHHMADGTMGATWANYIDEDWAGDHCQLLVQTPGWKKRFTVQGARVIDGREQSKRADFAGSRDFSQYVHDQIRQCAWSRPGALDFDPESMVTLCTCSYTRYDDERTLVYAW